MGKPGSSLSAVYSYNKAHDTHRREVLYNTVTEFVILMNSEIQTKEYPKET
jgi:hypothetical protein